MGNQNTFQSHLDIVDLNTNYTYETKYTDSRFGEIKLLKRRETGERIFQKDFTSNSAKEFEEYVNKIKRRVVLIHPNLLHVLGYNTKKDDMFCADFYRVSLFFEHFETDLEKEIFKRNATKNYFSETELRCLLDCVISSAAFLEKNQLSHGDIRPFNILITKNREYKICDSLLFQSIYNPAYFGLLEGLEAKAHYPSPQVFKYYKTKTSKGAEFNPYKNDVYGLGMSVLVAAQLEPVENAYDFTNKRIRQEVVDHALGNLKNRYSEGFVEALRVLISNDEVQRPTFVELDDEIKAYRADIRAKANLERTLEAQRSRGGQDYARNRQQQEREVRANYNETPHIVDDEVDKKVRRAVERSEGTVNRASPTKRPNQNLDTYIHSYIKREPVQGDRPLLQDIAPHLRMDNRFTPSLKVYSNQNYATNSQYQSQIPPRHHIISETGTIRGGESQYYSHDAARENRDYRQPPGPSPHSNVRTNHVSPYVGNPPSYGAFPESSDRENDLYSNTYDSRIPNNRYYA